MPIDSTNIKPTSVPSTAITKETASTRDKVSTKKNVSAAETARGDSAVSAAQPAQHPAGRGVGAPMPIEAPGAKRSFQDAGITSSAEQTPAKKIKNELFTMRETFNSNLPEAKQILDFALHLGIHKESADWGAASTSAADSNATVTNQTLLDIANTFYQQKNLSTLQDDVKIVDHLQRTQKLLANLQSVADGKKPVQDKLDWFLERASEALDTPHFMPDDNDLLVTDGILSQPVSAHRKESACADSKLALSFALRQLDHYQASNNHDDQRRIKTKHLEKIVSLKTILNDSKGLLDNTVSQLLKAAGRIDTPDLAQQRENTRQRNNLLAQFEQNFPPARGGLLAEGLQNIPRPAPMGGRGNSPHPKRYQSKMRAHLAAAAALIKFGDSDQKSRALDLVESVKTLFESSKARVYNLNHADTSRTGAMLRQGHENLIAEKHDTLLCKAVCLEIAAGRSETALNYLLNAFDSTDRKCELLIKLIGVAKTNISLADKSRLAELFQQPLMQLSERIQNDNAMPLTRKADVFRQIAGNFSDMARRTEASRAFNQAIEYLTLSNQQLQRELNTQRSNVISQWSHTCDAWSDACKEGRSLMISLQRHGHTDKIRQMITQQPQAIQPEMLADACLVILSADQRQVSDTLADERSVSEIVEGYWSDAKDTAMALTDLPRKVDALLTLTDTRYASLHAPNEAQSLIAQVRAMNDGSESFQRAFQRFEYRVGPLNP